MNASAGVSLGQLLLALDRTMVSLSDAPRGLDMPVRSAALVDADDIRLGLAGNAGNADVFFLLGVPESDVLRWLDGQARGCTAIFLKDPSSALVTHAVGVGIAVVAVDPRARWERLYRLVTHVIDHHGDRHNPQLSDIHDGTDLFSLAQSIAERAGGMISIEDAQSHVLAYSASNDEADELRRLSILGRAGPSEHLEWIASWGIFGALRTSQEVVRVAERPELGLRPRLAIGIHRQSTLPEAAGASGSSGPDALRASGSSGPDALRASGSSGPDALRASGSSRPRRTPGFLGTIWLQEGSRPLAENAEDVLRGAAVLAARIMARLAAAPSTNTLRVRELLGLAADNVDVATVARELDIAADGRAAVIGFRSVNGNVPPGSIALSASAFRNDAQVASGQGRVYVLFPQIAGPAKLRSWVRGTVAALDRELDAALNAVIAAPVAGLAGAASARKDVDRVFDSADRHPGVIKAVTSVDEAHTTVVLDEIVSFVAADGRLIDPRLVSLRDYDDKNDGSLLHTLRVYLDCFGDVTAASQGLHVHPNTVRYRVRRIEKILGASLAEPDDRLVLALGLRALLPASQRPAATRPH